MDVEPIVAAFVFGFAAYMLRLPPLVGYLIAGFALYGVGYEGSDAITTLGDIGVLLLLFSIGLKLKVRTLTRPVVWGTATVFAIVGTTVGAALLLGIGALGMPLAEDLDMTSALTVGFAFSFCSTVFAIKVLEERGDAGSNAGRIAIGVLILQDIFAVAYLVAAGGKVPSIWAIAVIPGAIVVAVVSTWLLGKVGHGEVLILFGFALALGIGAEGFDAVGLKADLGALIAGVLLSGHPKASEMSDRLLSFKDLFLVGFFLSIGLGGTPPLAGWIIAAIAILLIPLRTVFMTAIVMSRRIKTRNSLRTSMSLSTYSEFGLIVAAAALAEGTLDQAWVSTIGVTVAASFVVASLVNGVREEIEEFGHERIERWERQAKRPEDEIIDLSRARTIVFGMGRIGTGAFDELVVRGHASVIGVERGADRCEEHRREGRDVVQGDAFNRDFWESVRFHDDVELVVAAMNNHHANLETVARIQEYLPNARIAAIAQFGDEIAELQEAGVDVARNLYEEAGQALAADATPFEEEPPAAAAPRSGADEPDPEGPAALRRQPADDEYVQPDFVSPSPTDQRSSEST